MNGTKAVDFQIDLEAWRRLCSDAVLLAKGEKVEEFTHKMNEGARKYGLNAFVSGDQMRWLAQIADQVPPILRRQGPQAESPTKVAGVPFTQLRQHRCSWPGCHKNVSTAMWGCLEHWRRLPQDMRTTLWKHFEPGQSVATQTPEYVAAFAAIQQWIKENTDAQAS